MQQNLIALRTVLERIDGDSFETLEGRITFQKRIYLAQALGLDLGYTFVWHHYGPYSSELADDGLLLETGLVDASELSEPLRFTDSAERSIASFARLAEAPSGITLTAWLELLSSLHYLGASTSSLDFSDVDNRATLTAKLLAAKPYFGDSLSMINEALDRLADSELATFASA